MNILSNESSIQLKGKYVWVRFDWNVPIDDNGQIADTHRLNASRDSLNALRKAGAKIMILAHYGRPSLAKKAYTQNPQQNALEYIKEEEYSFAVYIKQLSDFFGFPLYFGENPLSDKGRQIISRMEDGDVVLWDNVRFFAGEEANDTALAKALAHLCLEACYVNDAFSCAHRAHVSTVGLSSFLLGFAGIQLARECMYLDNALSSPKRPLWAVIGGAKVSSKIEILKHLSQKVDGLIIGGAMANTFLKAQGIKVGNSLVEDDYLSIAEDILKMSHSVEIVLPIDARVAISLDSKNSGMSQVLPCGFIHDSVSIFDIGPETEKLFASKLEQASAIIWNGPMGVFENPAYAEGTLSIATAIASQPSRRGCPAVEGGGDTVAAIHSAKNFEKYTYVSTAGGAFLEWMEGKTLPAIAALEKTEACYS